MLRVLVCVGMLLTAACDSDLLARLDAPDPAPPNTPSAAPPEATPEALAETPSECRRNKPPRLPTSDLPGDGEAEQDLPLASYRYYYGIGVPVDYRKARLAAVTEREDGYAPIFGGDAVLMMLYANGFGVDRNLDLAIAFACQIEGSETENHARVAHLRALRSGPGKRPFDLCDDITSGFMQGHCAGLASERRAPERRARLQALLKATPIEARYPFRLLQRAARAFWEARTAHELDLSAGPRAALIVAEEERLKDAFIEALAQVERRDLPRFGPAAFARSEAALETLRRRIDRADWHGTSLGRRGVETARAAWLDYRKAWVRYGKRRFEWVSEESWMTWLNRQRLVQLRRLPLDEDN